MFESQNIDAWVDHMQGLHPQEMEFSLDRPRKVLEDLALVDNLPYLITVAGTNGKGSCVELLSQAFRCADISVGSYTSPHLVRFNERIRIDGVEVSDELLISAFIKIEKVRNEAPLTFFEFTSLAAFVIFSRSNLDVLVLEAGLGGRLDVMNLLDADLLLLTNVALDHTNLLGDTREKIGYEKAGLMRSGQLVICGDRDTPKSVTEKALAINAQLRVLGKDFDYTYCDGGIVLRDADSVSNSASLPVPFSGGLEQQDNAACAAVLLKSLTQFKITESVLIDAFGQAKIFGRKQILSHRPLIILDVAHNEAAVDTLSAYLQSFTVSGEVHAIFGMLADKSVVPALEHVVEHVDNWFLVELDSPRALSINALEECLNEASAAKNLTPRIKGKGASSELWDEVMKLIKDDDLLIVFGSFLSVGDILVYQSVTK